MGAKGHSSTHTPQSTHFEASMTLTSSTVIASWGQASAHAPQATQRLESTVGICSPGLSTILQNLRVVTNC